MAAAREKDVVIKVRGLVTGFGSKILHDHIDLDVYRGEVLGVVGGSGSGKSVLMRTIISLIRPKEGTIEVLGRPVSEAEVPAMRALEMRWGVLFQEGALFSSQTVAENIQVPLREYTDMSQQLMDEIAAMKLTLVGLPPDTAEKYPSELSGGMKKRAGLDPISANQFDELIRRLQKALGLTVFLVTHDLDTLRAVTDRIAVLVNKKLVVGTIEELRKNPDPWIQDYFSGVRGRAALAGMETD